MKEQDAAHSQMADLEFLREYAKCGIHHNHAHNESNLKHKLQTLDAAISELTRLRSELQQKDEVIKDFIKLQNEMLERVIEYEGGVTEFAKGKTEAYRYTAKKMNDLFVWHDFKKIDL